MNIELKAAPSFSSVEGMSRKQGAKKLAAGLLGNIVILALLVWGIGPTGKKPVVARRVQMVSMARLPEAARLPEVVKPVAPLKSRPVPKAKIFEAPRPDKAPILELPAPPRIEPARVEAKVILPEIEAPSMPAPKPVVGTFASTEPPVGRAERQTAQIATGGFGSSTVKIEPKPSPAIVTAGLFARQEPSMSSKAGERARLETQSGFESSQIVGQRNVKRAAAEVGALGGNEPSVPRARSTTMTLAGSFDSSPASPKSNRLEPRTNTESEFRGVEILRKPRPLYTEEARRLGIEGEVHLRILFGADGRLKVLEVVRGLGHGLDENAALAASQIQFRPASKQGQTMEQSAIVRVQFQLAN